MSDTGDKSVGASKSDSQVWSRMSPRAKWLVGTAATVFVLAGVILGVSALSAPKSSAPATLELTAVQQSNLAYQKGLASLQAGETSAAVVSLEKAVELDPNNDEARAALARIRQPAASAGAGGSSSTPAGQDGSGDSASQTEAEPGPEPDDPAFSGPIDDLVALLPAQSEDFSLGQPDALGADATVAGTPVSPVVTASRALWTVHDRKTPEGAAKFVASVSKSLYAKDKATPAIDGTPAYFGTDGTRFATVVYVRGRYVFEVVLASADGKPKQLKAEAVDAAKAFPDKVEKGD